jgi:probable F420-dependent oxidoreductase
MRYWMATAFLPTDEALAYAEQCDALGYHGVTVSDHLFYAREYRSRYPYSEDGKPYWEPSTHWPDPWVLIAAMAARTQRLRFTTNVYVAPARDLFTVAKSVATAAVVSSGRVSLGVGAGWCEEEFEQTGQDFASRGKRLNEMIPLLRRLWTGEWVSQRSDHYDLPEVCISPVPSEPIPILVGGETKWAMRRAARLADGWMGTAYRPDRAEEIVAELQGHRKKAGREGEPFEVILALLAMPDPALYRRFEDLGVTGMLCAPWMMAAEPTLEARRAEIERFAEDVIAKT